MKATTATILGVLLLGPVLEPPAALAGEPDMKKGALPELVLVRVRAAKDGTVLDVDFVNSARGKLVQTATGLMRRHLAGAEGQPALAVDWEKVVTEGLDKLRKDQGLNEETEVKVAADDHLDFGAAMAVVACCRKAGFNRVDFAESTAGRVVIDVAADGKFAVGGHAVTALEIKTHLQEVARVARGADHVEIVVRAHPQAKYAAVFRLLKDLKEGGFRATEVSSQDSASPR